MSFAHEVLQFNTVKEMHDAFENNFQSSHTVAYSAFEFLLSFTSGFARFLSMPHFERARPPVVT